MRVVLGFVIGVLALAVSVPRSQAGARERKIKKLQRELARLEASLKRALRYRAKYRTLRAGSEFQRLGRSAITY